MPDVLPLSGWHAQHSRLAALAERAELVRSQLLQRMLHQAAAGSVIGEWLWWWIFPGLACRVACRSSLSQRSAQGITLGPSGADLASPAEAIAYLQNTALRDGIIASFKAVQVAMTAHSNRAPFRVLDAHVEGRLVDGEWTRGPVNSFRLFCCASIFVGVAQLLGDDDVKQAALATLHAFRESDGMIYRASMPGTAGWHDDTDCRITLLYGIDGETLLAISDTLNWGLTIGIRSSADMRQEADTLFQKIDRNGSGEIDKDELLDHLLESGQEPEVIADIFGALDSDADGSISLMEWRSGYKSYLRSLSEAA